MDELLREFLTETNESLDVADVELVKFEQEPNNAAILNNIFRLVHTIKGTCGFIGLPRLAKLAHAAETLMDKFREGVPVTPAAVSLVLKTIDRIKDILAKLEENGGQEPEGSDADLIELLEKMAAGETVSEEVVEEAEVTVGTIVDQVLERPLMPGEIPLDELERIFRETEVENPAAKGKTKAKKAPAKAKEKASSSEEKPSPAAAPAKKEEPETKAPVAKAPETPAKKPVEDQPAANNSSSVSSQSIRVNLDALEHLMTMVSELVLTRNQLMEIARRQEDSDFKVSLQRLSTVTAELQEGVMRTRMQPIGHAWQKLPRIVRDLAQDLGKQIELEMVGADTELDRQVLDLIKDPLTHMVRNSADHGLETTEERRLAGKPEKGLVRLSAFHEGGHIIIEISDDGRGLNTDRIREKALENRLATEAELAKMSDAQIHRFIFHAGFSTAEKVTSVSGRGVGMDVVRSNIEIIGGNVDVRSTQGKGSTFVIKIPLTLAIVPALIVEVAGERFAVPQLAVVELVRIQPDSEHKIERLKDAPVLRLRDKLLPIVHLGALLGSVKDELADQESGFIAVMQVGNQIFGVIVDAVFHTEEIVVKPMSSMLRHIGMFSGSTILGDGRVIMIVDPNGVAQQAASSIEQTIATATADAQEQEESNDAVSMLVFRAGGREPKAVPLSLVTRLEEFETEKVEWAGGQPILNYRGALIPLVYVNHEVEQRTTGTQPMLVFSDDGNTMGLVVDEIVDIVQEPLNIELPSETPGLLGSAVLGGKATDIVDISHFLEIAFRDAPEQAERKGKKLLFVGGNVFYRNMVEPILRSAGYRVSLASSAEDALAQITEGHRFDLVVTDLDTPAMDPAAFAAAIRGQAEMQHVPLMALGSAKSRVRPGEENLIGFDRITTKIDRSELIAAIKQCAPIYGEAA
ncbi:chemotaxis protein CheW [Afifella marina]|uniref:Chemotaxis protein CheA n=2 Tax=Hyphomicrobiales TaxID=356 RepID=A0A1G5MUH8_AFIMA|nr:chemotaxis protein CheW [Afifella marina]MBK1622007.1 hybrid sensor histidine kinase/response regulator [Afifella marina DSM 2698]MBK1627800.1 hybrid sensor histidine kinase/response regulator [Afifella marina]MBK5916767.1 hybrid sensor histidine kinase/response regulator [Afifella marina]RAI19907.1 hybrid sensor histidine kinase/response regulator [Afifella marina DSM 2698]SCZ28743.1 two-component system, chemotaxis family, sensor kinase CheA [Afifella marina DSM 2698]